MTHQETLFFIGKCLTINYEKHNFDTVKSKLLENEVDWDAVVKVSTAHYIFPALYLNLKRADFLKYLPKDLVDYMEYITQLNRKRNRELIIQAKEVNEILFANKITPIFLKGIGNLIQGLYEDVGERMIGDIDIIISEKDYKRSISILQEFGYSSLRDNVWKDHRHYPEMTIENRIGAVEIHKEFLRKEHSKKFNYSSISKNIQTIYRYNVLSYNDQFLLTILSNQVNDFGFLKKNINLRSVYDILLISKKLDLISKITDNRYLSKVAFNFITLSEMVLNNSFETEKKLFFSKVPQNKIKHNLFSSPNKILKLRNNYIIYYLNKKNTFKEFLFNKSYRSYTLKKYFKIN